MEKEKELVFIEDEEITEEKQRCYDYDLVQNFIPKGKSQLREADEQADQSKRKTYDVAVAIAVSSQPFNKKLSFMSASRERISGNITIGRWGTVPISSPPDSRAAIDFITDSFTKDKLIPLGCYRPEIKLIKTPSFCKPVLFLSNPRNEFYYPVRGFNQELWDKSAGSSLLFWEANKEKTTIKDEKAEDFYYLPSGLLSPRITLWHFNNFRSGSSEPLLTSCINQIGHYFNKQSQVGTNIAKVKLASITENNQPNYDDLDQLQFLISVERGFDATTTIVVLKVEGDKITLDETKMYENPVSSEVVHAWVHEKMTSLKSQYSETLNLEADPEIEAVYSGKITFLYTNDHTLNLTAKPIRVKEKEIQVKDFDVTVVDLFDETIFNFKRILTTIRSAIAEEIFDLSKEIKDQFYEDIEFKYLNRINRSIAMIFSRINA